MLLSLAWPVAGFSLIIFIAWVPLLLMEHYMSQDPVRYKRGTVFAFAYTGIFTWNLLTTWWVYKASFGGAVMAIVANSLLMAMVFMIYSASKKRIGGKFAPFIFAAYWIAFEFFHLDWDLSWPWLTLGNVFAADYKWIQWYEYTGVFGGGLWIIAVNFMVLALVKRWIAERSLKKLMGRIAAIIGLIAVPVIISYVIYSSYPQDTGKRAKVDVVVVQPNIDPYNVKFSTDEVWQAQQMIKVASPKLDNKVDYLVLPETALSDDHRVETGNYVYSLSGISENDIHSSRTLALMQTLIDANPKLKIVSGASTNRVFNASQEISKTARQLNKESIWYDSYNTALQMDSTGDIQLYHKSKLVPGVEKMPFPALFKPLESFAIDLGGTVGSLGVQDERTVFFTKDKKAGIAPVICYESIYGEYVSEYVKNGARLIFIVTNDGWWGDTPGYKQHLNYGRLRAIETRTSIARSANTGISCFINERGDISQPLGWWVQGAIRQELPLNNGLTFYVRFGDYIARTAMAAAVVFIVYSIVLRFRRNKKS